MKILSQEQLNIFIAMIFFLIFACTDCLANYFHNRTLHCIFKITPIIPLIILLINKFPNKPLIYMPFVIFIIGDLLLLLKKKHYYFFVFGAILFLVGHVIILVYFINSLTVIPYGTSAVSIFTYIFVPALILFIISLYFLIFTRKKTKNLAMAGAIYISTMLINIFLAVCYGIEFNYSYAFLFIIGYIFYLISDLLIVLDIYKMIKDPHIDFHIIIFYYLALLSLAFGFILLN